MRPVLRTPIFNKKDASRSANADLQQEGRVPFCDRRSSARRTRPVLRSPIFNKKDASRSASADLQQKGRVPFCERRPSFTIDASSRRTAVPHSRSTHLREERPIVLHDRRVFEKNGRSCFTIDASSRRT